MKKTLLAALLLVGLMSAGSANAAGAFDWIWNLADEFGTPYEHLQATPETGVYVVGYQSADRQPDFIGLGAGITYDAGNLVVTDLTYDAIPGLFTELQSIHTNMAGKASTTHSHVTGDITGLQTFVDNRVASSTSLPQRVRVQTDANGAYTWTFPFAFASGTLPVVLATPEDSTSAASTDVRITALSTTSVSIQSSRITTVLGILSLNSTPQIYVHLSAQKP